MGEELTGARQAVTALLPLAVGAAGGMRADEDRRDYLARVRQLAVDLWLESTAESETVRRIAELSACRTFPAVLLGVRIEPSTTRGVLTLRSWGPDGERQEEIRTDRTDDPRGVRTVELARTLIGHRVTVYKLEEPARTGHQRYRCAKHLLDLGPADLDPVAPGPADGHTAVPASSGDPAGDGVAPRPRRRRSDPSTWYGAAPSPVPVAPSRPAVAGVPVEQAREEVRQAIGGDEEYRAAALHGIMQRAATDDDGAVLNAALLRMLAARTPDPESAAGRKILADYRGAAG